MYALRPTIFPFFTFVRPKYSLDIEKQLQLVLTSSFQPHNCRGYKMRNMKPSKVYGFVFKGSIPTRLLFASGIIFNWTKLAALLGFSPFILSPLCLAWFSIRASKSSAQSILSRFWRMKRVSTYIYFTCIIKAPIVACLLYLYLRRPQTGRISLGFYVYD